ncbi:hypothetical protein TIFTF001_025215 [Ficus carica]|uniref:Uncharacterized protein n=1 Tax=Ficus carica TaxID=3494 RepID=A0AA88AYM3_FICCA|nr:hypothetical protein TIFTF001_025215 [Ficus carica]
MNHHHVIMKVPFVTSPNNYSVSIAHPNPANPSDDQLLQESSSVISSCKYQNPSSVIWSADHILHEQNPTSLIKSTSQLPSKQILNIQTHPPQNPSGSERIIEENCLWEICSFEPASSIKQNEGTTLHHDDQRNSDKASNIEEMNIDHDQKMNAKNEDAAIESTNYNFDFDHFVDSSLLSCGMYCHLSPIVDHSAWNFF